MTSIMNEGMDDGDYAPSNFLNSGFDDDKKRARRISLKSMLFKLVNLMTFHNVITSSFFIILLLIEFIQFLGFVFYQINLAAATTSGFAVPSSSGSSPTANQSSTSSTMGVTSLAYISYFNMKQVLMDIRSSVTTTSQGQTASYVLAGLSLFLISVNFVIMITMCKYAKDGYDALFASPLTKLLLKCCGVIQLIFVKILALPLLMILISILICTTDESLASPNSITGSVSASGS